MSQAEKPALEHFFKGKSELSVLDIGCNDGARTFHRFSDDRISRVIGLEYNQQLVERANSQFGNTKFSFYQMDVDRDSFSADFQKLCTEPEDREFDLICLSFVLMHLHDGEKLLRTLKNFLKKGGVIFITESNDRISTLAFLKKGGVIFITESNDRISTLAPDEKNLLGQFLDILKEDKYAGKRETGQAVPGWLTNCGYDHIHVWCKGISAAKGEQRQKENIFQTFFSYLPEDVEILLAEEPDNRKYQDWQNWLKKNYEELQQLILSEESEITMGMQILSCEKGSL